MIYLRTTLILILSILFNKAHANTYYFSESTGDDSRSSSQAQNAATPWKSLNRLNNFATQLNAGDSVLFKRGETFEGNIYASASGTPGNFITYCAYGQGSRPVISGFKTISGWTTTTGNIREAALNSSAVNMLLMNGVVKAKGRYPNASASGGGFLTIERVNAQNTFTDDQLPASPDWTGAFAVIRKTRWVLDRDTVIRHTGNTITFSASSGYGASQGYGYFIQDDIRTLDEDGEWYFNASAKKMYVYAVNAGQLAIKASVGSHLVQIENRAYLQFEDLRFEGANVNAFELNNAQQVHIRNCEIAYTGINAINAGNSNDIQVEGCGISYTNNIAVNTNNCSGTIIRNSNISCTGTFPGMGQNNSGSYEAIILKGNNNRLEYNSIDSTGYIPITFSGNNVVIKNNFINGFAFVKDDGGGIYTWNNAPGATPEVNRFVTGNIVLNGIGAGAGTDDVASARVHGIYIDDNAANINITGNTVANCGEYGIFVHNARNLTIRGNTAYNNFAQLVLSHDDIAPQAQVKDIVLGNNIYFSRLASQRAAEFRIIDNDAGSFGNSDSNYYVRPIDDELTIYTSSRINGTYYNALLDLEAWQVLYNKDLHSFKSPVKIAPYRITNLGANKYENGNFNNNISGLYVYANGGGNAAASFTNSAGLDNGALKIDFSGQTYVIIGVGRVEANKNYVLRFSHKGAGNFKNMQVFLRQSQSPYNDLSARKFRRITTNRSESEFVLTANVTENDASIVFELEDQSSPVYFDNIQLAESDITVTNPGDSIRFEYNASAIAKTVALDGTYIDARKNIYAGSITLSGYASAVLIKLAGLYPLASDFLSFRGAKAHNGISLQWTTSRGATTVYYEIERSATGTGFSKLGQVAVSATGTYQFTDVRPLNGSNYYRLRYMQGSNALYSNIIRVDNNASRKALKDLNDEDMLVIPNPAAHSIQVIINALPVTQPAVIKIQTTAGQVVKSLPVSLKENRVMLDISSLKAGTYNLVFMCNGKVLVKRFLKIG